MTESSTARGPHGGTRCAACGGPECPRCANTCTADRMPLGVTRLGTLVQCLRTFDGGRCGEEWIVPDGKATEAAAERDAAVEAERAERVHGRIIGPLGTGELRRLRHPEMVEAMQGAATHSQGTVESVVMWLRAHGFELAAAEPVSCTCLHGAPGDVIRNPGCRIHGDADGLGDPLAPKLDPGGSS